MTRALCVVMLFVGFCNIAARWLQLPVELAVPVSLLAVFLAEVCVDPTLDFLRALHTLALSLYISGLIAAGMLGPAAE